MEFGLSEEQLMLTESLRGFLDERLPMNKLREIAEGGLGFDGELWSGLTEQGIMGIMVPEDFGGLGLSLLDAAVAAEALGYHAAPTPFAAALVMAPLTLIASGDRAQQKAWLPRIASGEVRIGVGFAGMSGQTGEAVARLDGNKLSGCITGVLDGGDATHFIVYLGDGRAALFAAVEEPGVSVSTHRSLDRTRPVTALVLHDARAAILGAANDPKAAATAVLDAGRVMLAGDTLGAAQSMFDKALLYSKERVQFNRVIGSFQAVKHTLADIITMLEPCRSLVWYAAHAQDGPAEEARVAALQAKAHLGDAGREIARLATEIHGGMGFTDLLGLHYWFKRIAFNRQLLGAPERCRHEAAVAQEWVS